MNVEREQEASSFFGELGEGGEWMAVDVHSPSYFLSLLVGAWKSSWGPSRAWDGVLLAASDL